MYILNNDSQNYQFCRLQLVVEETLDTKLKEPTYQSQIKVPNVVKPTNKETLL